ncbi:MAG: cellulase family glycosylhydrolase [Verrucomicrobiota bacterium]
MKLFRHVWCARSQLIAVCLLLVLSCSEVPAAGMVHQADTTVVDGNGQPLKFRGVSLGGWLQWEGWLFGEGILLRHSTIVSRLQEMVGADETKKFTDGIHANFITGDDIVKIAALGFNSVRIPLNSKLFEDEAAPYVYKPEAWALLDRVLDWCAKSKMYVIIDLHCLPGGQSKWAPADALDTGKLVWNQPEYRKRTVALWKAIAARYHDRTIIAGYDLINEPVAPHGKDLVALYGEIIAAVREVDPEHMILLEGDDLATDLSIFKQPPCSNLAYSFHMYNWFGDNRKKKLAEYLKTAREQKVPLWCGEFGENSYPMIATTVDLYENTDEICGWAFWTWKKAPNSHPGLAVIKVPEKWRAVMSSINGFFHRKPAKAVEAGQEFLAAVQFSQVSVDLTMREALLGKRAENLPQKPR